MVRPHLHFTSLTPRDLCGDIVETYRLAAEKLGYPTSYADRCLQPGAINILFFFWDVPWEVIAPYHPDCIVVNFEPMVPGTHAWRDNYLDVLRRCYLWEYSQTNFQRNRELHFNVADYVPLGWEEQAAPILPLAEILPDAQQDIDVVFFGTMTQRRADVLDALISRGLRVQLTNGGQSWTVEERDAYLRRAKLVLNFHNWDESRVVEIGRLSILFRQRKAVVCELYPDSEIENDLRAAVVGAPYHALTDTVLALLVDAPRRAALERASLPLLARRAQTEIIGPALDRFLQWRSQQALLAAPDQAICVSVCLMMDRGGHQSLVTTLAALKQQTLHNIELLVSAPIGVDDETLTQLTALVSQGFAPSAQVLRLPAGCDTAAARNMTMRRARGEYLVFLAPGDADTPDRLHRQLSFLEARPEIDVVGSWLAVDGDAAEPIRGAELDHEIKAELLGLQPLALRGCMLRKRFLDKANIRHDPEFAAHEELQFLCKCAQAGARFARIPAPLHGEEIELEPARKMKPALVADFAIKARVPLIAHLFPQLSHHEVQRIAQLYAHLWAPEPDFAALLLAALAKASATAGCALGSERQTLARVLRREAVRLVQVFFEAKLIDREWLDIQYLNAEVALFLTPVSALMPWRPSTP